MKGYILLSLLVGLASLTEACEDIWTSAKCAKKESNGKCTTSSNVIANCQATCGYCDTDTTTTTTTTTTTATTTAYDVYLSKHWFFTKIFGVLFEIRLGSIILGSFGNKGILVYFSGTLWCPSCCFDFNKWR